MTIQFSEIQTAQKAAMGGHFEAVRFDLGGLPGYANPVMGLDHFSMAGPTFAPHPHSGFSAVTYIFPDSAGGMRNRDSLGNDFVAGAGELIWTQAASGMMHDELPAVAGQAVHGIQLFVNLGGRNKELSPQVFRLAADEAPVAADAAGNRVRVLTGACGEVRSPLQLAEPFTLLDATLAGQWTLRLDAAWNTLLYVISGEVSLAGASRSVAGGQMIGMRADQAEDLLLTPAAPSHVLVLAGPANNEPVVAHGPFIMNTPQQLEVAFNRYRDGGMGRLSSL